MKDYVVGSCHEWRLKTYSLNEYRCVECGQECVGTKNMKNANECKQRMIPRSWLPEEKK